jgi:hypothetical protein
MLRISLQRFAQHDKPITRIAVILSEAKNLSLFPLNVKNNSQRCFASLNVTNLAG